MGTSDNVTAIQLTHLSEQEMILVTSRQMSSNSSCLSNVHFITAIDGACILTQKSLLWALLEGVFDGADL